MIVLSRENSGIGMNGILLQLYYKTANALTGRILDSIIKRDRMWGMSWYAYTSIIKRVKLSLKGEMI